MVIKNGKMTLYKNFERVFFEKGYYVYVGSALGTLSRRVHRHELKNKKLHWHIDYITPSKMRLEKKPNIQSTCGRQNK